MGGGIGFEIHVANLRVQHGRARALSNTKQTFCLCVTMEGYVFQELIEALCGHSALMHLMMDESISHVDSKCRSEI